MKRIAVGLLIAVGLAGGATAGSPPSRGELMKACMSEWKTKKAGPDGATLKYTSFLSECLKRRNAAPAMAH